MRTGKSVNIIFCFVSSLLFLFPHLPAYAVQKGVGQQQPPAAAVSEPKEYTVKGFRGLYFNMDEKELRQVIKKNFKVKGDIESGENLREQTRFLKFSVDNLKPGPGTAEVFCVLGYQSRELIQVNIVWRDKTPNSLPVITAAMHLANYFNDFSWKSGGVSDSMLIDGRRLVFLGTDANSGAVMLTMHGYDEGSDRKPDTSADTSSAPEKNESPSLLILSYIKTLDNPDVFHIKKGEF